MVFFNFFDFFGIFSYSWGWNETERQDLFSFFLGLFQPILALNEAITVFFNFFAFFWNFLLLVGLERNGMIFLVFFWNFL